MSEVNLGLVYKSVHRVYDVQPEPENRENLALWDMRRIDHETTGNVSSDFAVW
jgi:hypothetical protein